MHCFVLRKLFDHLEVSSITLVCQDWGGLTGLTIVKDAPHLFSNLVIMNTGLPAPILNFNEDFGDPSKGASPILETMSLVGDHFIIPLSNIFFQLLPFIL